MQIGDWDYMASDYERKVILPRLEIIEAILEDAGFSTGIGYSEEISYYVEAEKKLNERDILFIRIFNKVKDVYRITARLEIKRKRKISKEKLEDGRYERNLPIGFLDRINLGIPKYIKKTVYETTEDVLERYDSEKSTKIYWYIFEIQYSVDRDDITKKNINEIVMHLRQLNKFI